MASPSSFQRRPGGRFAGPEAQAAEIEGAIDSSADLSAKLRCEASREGLDGGANAAGTRGHAIAHGPRPDSAESAVEVGFAWLKGHVASVSSGKRVAIVAAGRGPRQRRYRNALRRAHDDHATWPRLPRRRRGAAAGGAPRYRGLRGRARCTRGLPRPCPARTMRRPSTPSIPPIPSTRSLAMPSFTPFPGRAARAVAQRPARPGDRRPRWTALGVRADRSVGRLPRLRRPPRLARRAERRRRAEQPALPRDRCLGALESCAGRRRRARRSSPGAPSHWRS